MKTKNLISKCYTLLIAICFVVSASAQTNTHNLTANKNKMIQVAVSESPSDLVRPFEFSDTLTLKSKKGSEIFIYNTLGTEMWRMAATDGTNKINISELKAGRYLLKNGNRRMPFTKK